MLSLRSPASLSPNPQGHVPRFSTNQVPTDITIGTSADTSDAFVADWRELMIGARVNFSIQFLREKFADSGQVAFLAWQRADVQLAREIASGSGSSGFTADD